MPTRRSTGPAVRLADCTLHEKLALRAPVWSPARPGPLGAHVRFASWGDYFALYDQVREELLAERAPWPPFAELARPRWAAGRDPQRARAAYEAHREAYGRRDQ